MRAYSKYFIALFVFAVLSLALSWYVAGRLIAPVPASLTSKPEHLPTQLIKLDSQSGTTLSGWHAKAANSRGVVILLHGIRSNRASMLERAKFLFNAGYSCILIDFQAHGESKGEYITVGYLEKFDVLAAVEYAKQNHQNEAIAVLGVSMGGAATLFANPKNINIAIIESVYPTLKKAVHNRVKARLGIFSWLPAEILLAQLKPRLGISLTQLSPAQAIQSANFPLVILSGTADKHTTVDDTQWLFKLAPKPKQIWLIPGAEHEDLYNYSGEEYRDQILRYLEQYMHQ